MVGWCEKFLIGIYETHDLRHYFFERFWITWSHIFVLFSHETFRPRSRKSRKHWKWRSFQYFAILRDGMVQTRGPERCATHFRSFPSCQNLPNGHMRLNKHIGPDFPWFFVEIDQNTRNHYPISITTRSWRRKHKAVNIEVTISNCGQAQWYGSGFV